MKKQIIILAALLIVNFQLLIINSLSAQNIGINTTGNAPNASAALDIDINQKGLLVPRMSTANRNAIVSPAHSLLIYNTTTDCFEAWNQTTLTWVAFGCISCQLPGALAAATHTPCQTQIVWNWNAVAGATGYKYNTVNNYSTATDNLTSTSFTQAGLTCNTAYTLYVWAYNACGNSIAVTLNQTTSACFIVATGGTITTDGNFKVHTFNSSGTFTVTAGCANVEYLVVAGGGGGSAALGGGGGAGGFLYNASYAVSVQSYPVTVGAGGGVGANGANSVFGLITALGGGTGADGQGVSGGSGGGSSSGLTGGAGTAGQGNNAGNASLTYGNGGGGGAGAVGGNGSGNTPGAGGNGSASSISGSSVTYSGGGGGGAYNTFASGGAGGTGGGGAGGAPGAAVAGTANTGGGGGGGYYISGCCNVGGAAGGSGIVIVRYQFQ